MNKRRTLPFYILTFFIASSLVSFFLLGSYVAYDYHRELKGNLKNSLQIIAEDIIRHELYTMAPDTLSQSIHVLESYHQSPYIQLFDHIEFRFDADLPDTLPEVTVTRKLPDGHYLLITSSLHNVELKTMSLIARLSVVFGIVLLLFILAYSLLLNHLFEPLRCLVRYCRDRTERHEQIRSCRGTLEVDRLKTAITELLDVKQTLFKEAAHEIKSPLAVLKARISLYKQNDAYEKARFVDESLDDIAAITSKLKELLFLKAIEFDMQQEKECVDMQEQCYLMQQAFHPILQKKGLTLDANWDENFALFTHKEALTKVMQAIFENIYLHTRQQSVIAVSVNARERRLRIVNEIGTKSDETLFSSAIGSSMIERLSKRLGYRYEAHADAEHYITTVVFDRTPACSAPKK